MRARLLYAAYNDRTGVIAMRRSSYASNNGLFYLLRDQLRSTSVIVNQNGTLNANNLYYPYGGARGGSLSTLTSKQFTGQYHEAGLPGGEGLSYYGARWYDAQLGRFISGDTLVPNPSNPQSLNRYSYGLNNPVKYTDPTGHYACLDADCESIQFTSNGPIWYNSPPLYHLISMLNRGHDSAAHRMYQILDETAGLTFYKYPSANRFLGLHFGGHFEGLGSGTSDEGFDPQFRDDYLYTGLWEFKEQPTGQVGHFLSAVAWGTTQSGPFGLFDRYAKSFVVGHEQFSDALPLGPVGQVWHVLGDFVNGTDIEAFTSAMREDAAGRSPTRDRLLQTIYDHGNGTPQQRQGNSMEDLRLSVKGYELGQFIISGALQTNRDLSDWVATNITAGD